MKMDKECKDAVKTGILLVFSVFCCALNYNLFLLPNDLVVGGVSGLAISFQAVTGIDSQIFIYVGNILLIFVGYFFLGKEETHNTVIGSILYPVLVTLTKPIATFLIPYFQFDEFILVAVLAGLLHGFGSGLVYKIGFSTGGSDVIVRIMSKYLHISEGNNTLIIYILVMIVGAFTFGTNKIIYAVIIIILYSIMIDKVMFGISDSKVFYVSSKKEKQLKDILLNEYKTGFTIIPTKGGYSHLRGTFLMCVLSNREYYKFKNEILKLDPEAFFIINDCYESQGGFRNHNLPFF